MSPINLITKPFIIVSRIYRQANTMVGEAVLYREQLSQDESTEPATNKTDDLTALLDDKELNNATSVVTSVNLE